MASASGRAGLMRPTPTTWVWRRTAVHATRREHSMRYWICWFLGISTICCASVDASVDAPYSADDGSGGRSDGGVSTMVCLTDTADCDQISANGCETNLLADSANCGACGKPCATDPDAGDHAIYT